MATPNYDIDYNDKRLTSITDARDDAIKEDQNRYDSMIADHDKLYEGLDEKIDAYKDDQIRAQNDKTELAIEKLEHAQEQAHKDYIKEQSGAYVDWKKQSNPYGVNAERMAAMGMTNTGYSESSQVRMYNTYQNRITAARESYSLAVQNYNIAIKDAQVQNNAAIAEIIYNAFIQQTEFAHQCSDPCMEPAC